ncbi:MAG: AraC family transcriptional regulator [Kiritimatiellia bacterium]|nr:AraC family transcriptional regulator [Kiritimatiellia bacterium]
MPILFHHGFHRPAAAPARGLPFGVRSVGHYIVKPQFVSADKKINFLHLSWCVRGSGIFEIEGRRRALKRHQVVLYYPNMRHYWYPDNQVWELFIMTLDGPFATFLPAAFWLEAGIYSAGPAPVDLFQKLFSLIRQPTKQAELKACAIAFIILTRAAGAHVDQTDELVNTAVERMHAQLAMPELNVKTLCASLGIRRAVLSARFHATIGISPGAYINRLRIQQALSLLRHTIAIGEVARRCGYTDAHYFSRVIRRITGYSPLQFRRLNQPDTGKRNAKD